MVGQNRELSTEGEFDKLEQALARAGKFIAYPAAPPLAARTGEKLRAAHARPTAPFWPRLLVERRAAVALAALVLALALLLAFPATRDALAQLLGLRTVRIILTTPTPSPTAPRPAPTAPPVGTAPSETLTPLSAPAAASTPTPGPRIVCCETTLEAARQKANFTLLLPPGEQPSRVYFQEVPQFTGAQQVVLIFGNPDAPRWTLYEAQNIVYGKMLYMFGNGDESATVLHETKVNGHPALWLSGAPHLLVYLDANGNPVAGVERTVNANTLAWEVGQTTLRLEGMASEQAAVQFAESLR